MDNLNGLLSLFVIVGTLGSLAVFFLILHLNKTVGKENETTGHIYDGIEELDNPMPSWWYWLFVLSIVYGLAYLVYYPGLGNFKGLAGWTSAGEVTTALEKAEQRYGALFASYREVPLEELTTYVDAVHMGRRLFANNCTVCHGATAEGSIGFPSLVDDEWIWGNAANIETTILHGRNAIMPPWGAALGEEGVIEVTEFVRLLSGQDADPSLAEKGRDRYATICVACHGAEGKGNAALGAPDMTNDLWLYGGSRAAIAESVTNGRNGQMPAFADRLGEDKVHILAAFVLSLQ